MHAEKLEYGWWERKRGNVLLPTTYKDKRNYVLTPTELHEYMDALLELKTAVDREYANAAHTHRVLHLGRLPTFADKDPVLFTLCHVLEFFIKMAKAKLRLMQLLLFCSRERRTGIDLPGEDHVEENELETPSNSGEQAAT
ncbi:MAG TPA: hypothetical protein VF077_10295 [Nitrospiraceae bacterium]